MTGLQFSSIHINKNHYQEYNFIGNEQVIDKLSQVNIFIGRNNSGKSRFIRKIFTDDEISFTAKELDIENFDNTISNYKQEFQFLTLNKPNDIAHYERNKLSLQNIQTFEFLKKRIDHSGNLQSLKSIINTFKEFGYDKEREHKALSLTYSFLETYNLIFENPSNISQHDYIGIYIPTLRGLRPLQLDGSGGAIISGFDNYLSKTQHDYFKSKENDSDRIIYTGLSLYKDLQEYSHGALKQREQLMKFQEFLSKSFFNNQQVDLIPRHKENNIYVRIGEHEEPIQHLGDGIQALIILTYPLFFNQDKVLKVFIEEPETHLHPGYQRVLMETLQREDFKHFQYFITTHSNHFLDITFDSNRISVYSIEQSGSKNEKPIFTITNVENADTNVLALIGVQNSSVFLSNCTIWVEGITDRIYLRKYLEIIQKDKAVQYKEDTHFSFVEYGGNNITHWSFLDSDDPNHKNILVDRLCSKLFLITDNDSTGFKKNEQLPTNPTKKMERLKQLQDKLGERFFCLGVREIENLLKPNILKKVILEYEGKNGELDSINFSKLKYDNYKYKKIGNYIDGNVKYSNKQDLTRKYSSDSGTVNDKVNFAKKAVGYINEKNDISVDAIALTEKVLLFIENMNK